MNLFLILSVIFLLQFDKLCLANHYDMNNDILSDNNQDDTIIINEQEDEPDQKSVDYSYLLSNDYTNNLLDTTTKSSIPDYDYELFKHQYDLNPIEEELQEDIIYIPVEYSIDSHVEYIPTTTATTTTTITTTTTTKKSPISLTTLLLNSIMNSTKFNQTYNSTYRSLNYTLLSNSTLLLKNQTNYNISNHTLTNVTTTTVQLNRITTLASKKTIEKTILKLESSFDEMYDIDAIPRQSLGHLIEKRIHNNNNNNNINDDKMMMMNPNGLNKGR
jgi:hypothetical protein